MGLGQRPSTRNPCALCCPLTHEAVVGRLPEAQDWACLHSSSCQVPAMWGESPLVFPPPPYKIQAVLLSEGRACQAPGGPLSSLCLGACFSSGAWTWFTGDKRRHVLLDPPAARCERCHVKLRVLLKVHFFVSKHIWITTFSLSQHIVFCSLKSEDPTLHPSFYYFLPICTLL